MQAYIGMFLILFIPSVILLFFLYFTQHLNKIFTKDIDTKTGLIAILIVIIVGMIGYIVLQSNGGLKRVTEHENEITHPNATELWKEINKWETKQGYQPFLEDVQLCELADQRIATLKSNWSTDDFKKIRKETMFSQWAENASRDISSETDILNRWLTSSVNKKNFEDYYQYSCVRCSDTYCVQLLANYPQKLGNANTTSSPTSSSNNIQNPANNNPVLTNNRTLVSLPNGSTYSCDSSAQQAVKDAGVALTNAEQQKNECNAKYTNENIAYRSTCWNTCSISYGIDRQVEYDTCNKACGDYYDKMSSNGLSICDTYVQAQRANLSNLTSKYCN